MTQLEFARKNIATPLAKQIARQEGISVTILLERIRKGTIVIPCNRTHTLKKPCGIGLGLRTKINANIGTSTEHPSIKEELKKLSIALKAGADAVMDLSVGGNLAFTRKEILKHSVVPVGTVPVYEIAVNARAQKGTFLDFDAQGMLETLETQATQGVDFFTIHAGVTKKSVAVVKRSKRILPIVSRGGAILASWIIAHKKENPFFEYYDKILDIARAYDVTLSLGDGLRPGSILDATDKAQITELRILGDLCTRARKKGVQVMIEGPGHIPLHQIEKNILLQKKICHGAPFYVLGPLVTDVAPGYDHITSAIGGALAASYGADFLCYVTPAEHLRHPTEGDVHVGVIAAKIAAHAADLVKNTVKAAQWDKAMSLARKKRDWKRQIALSIDPKKARAYRNTSRPHLKDVCTMCGSYCSIKLMEECLKQ